MPADVLAQTREIGWVSSTEKDLDGFGHLASSEAGARRTAAQEQLVDVVVEDDAEPLLIVLTEANGDLLGQGVTDGVGMTATFALHDLDRERRGCIV